MPGKLTAAQAHALKSMAASERGAISAYAARVSVATMYALSKRGFARAIGTGHMAFPANGDWSITTEGRAALALALTEQKQ